MINHCLTTHEISAIRKDYNQALLVSILLSYGANKCVIIPKLCAIFSSSNCSTGTVLVAPVLRPVQAVLRLSVCEGKRAQRIGLFGFVGCDFQEEAVGNLAISA